MKTFAKHLCRNGIASPGLPKFVTRSLPACLLAVLLLCAPAAVATTFYVDAAQANDSSTGLSWGTAKKTVQAGITAASSGDAVWVKAGTYIETITMKSGVSLYGGFTGSEASVDQRNVLVNASILNATTLGTRLHVVTMNGLTNARIDGMTIEGGMANGSGQDASGAGINCNNLNSTNTITNCTFISNVSSSYGSGIACLAASSPLISACIFIGNGVQASPLVLSTGGGALYCSASSPTVTSCTMGANYATTNGGGVYCAGGSLPVFTTCIFYANVVTQQAGIGSAMGGAVYCNASTPSFTGCAFSGNSAANNLLGSGAGGGAVYLAATSPVTFTNCLFSGNYTGASGGGAVYCTGSAPSFINCTISSNSSATSSANGGGVFLTGTSKAVFKNTLFENNTKYGIYEGDAGSDPTVSYCLFNNNPNGNYYDNDTSSSLTPASLNALSGNGGNLIGDPKFLMDGTYAMHGTWTAAPSVTNGMSTLTDSAASYPPNNALLGQMLNANTTQRQQWSIIGNTATTITIWGDVSTLAPSGSAYKIVDYHLGYGSAAIDAGTSTGTPSTDIETSPRPVDIPGFGTDSVVYDIGAYEAQLIYYADADRPDNTGDGLSWGTAKKTLQAAIDASTFARQVWVKGGGGEGKTYSEAITLRTGVSLYGGFAGNETVLARRNAAVNVTSINAATASPGFHAVTMDSISKARVDGFCILGGNANGTGADGLGGGIYANNADSTNTVAGCILAANNGTDGAGIGCNSSSPVISNCVISANSASGSGGGVLCRVASAPVLVNCIISGNLAVLGGAVGCDASSPTIINCTVSGDTASAGGSGIVATNGSNPVLQNVLFEGLPSYAVAEADATSDPVVTYCLFHNNPDGDYLDENTTPLTGAAGINALPGNGNNASGDPKFVMRGAAAIAGTWNAAPSYSSATFRTTLTNTAAAYTPNALVGRLVVPNTGLRRQSLIVGNTATTITVAGDATSFAANGDAYTVVDYHLSDLSAAVDTGGPGAKVPVLDLDGKVRPVDIYGLGANGTGTEFDIGVFEAQSFPPAVRSMVRASGDPTNAASVNFTVTFSKPVTGVDLADFALTTTGVSGASLSSVSADSGATRTVTVNTGTGDGSIRLDLNDNDTIIDSTSVPLGGTGTGNGSFASGQAYTIDKTPPTGTVSVNSGAAYCNSTSVTLEVTSDDGSGSGAAQMQFSNDNAAWSGWEDFAASKAWTLSAGDGAKTVYVQFKDAAGNSSTATISDGITLDTTPPTGTMVINSGAAFCVSTKVTLAVTSDDGGGSGVARMQFSNDNDEWSGWEDFAASKAWVLSAGDGAKTVYAQFKDAAGNPSTATISAGITLDTMPPTGTVVINSGAAYCNSTSVTLALTPADGGGSGVVQMQFSNDNAAWSGWEAFAASKAWTLSAGDGAKTVYAQFKDAVGNASTATISDGITLDTAPPTGTVVINNNRSATNTPNVTLALTWNDGAGGSGAVRMRFSDDGSHWTAWGPLAATRAYALPAGDGHKTVRVQYLDLANNRSATFSDYILLDTTLPTGSIIINNGASTTTTQSVTLGLSWSDGTGSGVTRMRFSDNGSTWTYWMPPTATSAHTLPLPNGYHTVRVQYLDGAGNYSAVCSDYIKLQMPGGKDAGAGKAAFSLAYTGSNPINLTEKSNGTITVVPQHANGSVTYQWYRDNGGTPEQVFGGTGATLTLKGINAEKAGSYYCEGSDSTSTVNSEMIRVQVGVPVPVFSGLGLAALAALTALGGATGLRRHRR